MTLGNASLCALILAMLAIPVAGWAAEPKPVDAAAYPGVIKLACVGDSITQGAGAEGGKSWPDQIRTLLGAKWEVKNFGVSGSTLLTSGDKPYQKEGAFAQAKAFNPDVVVVMLGTNDTKPQNWAHKDDFVKDYEDMIAQFASLPGKPHLYICYPPYIAGAGNFGISEANTKAEFAFVDAVAKATKAGIIDVHGALAGKDALIPDRVHPNTEGAGLIAKAVQQALTGKGR